jgi:hypothetical protein
VRPGPDFLVSRWVNGPGLDRAIHGPANFDNNNELVGLRLWVSREPSDWAKREQPADRPVAISLTIRPLG